jgi:hypothetical protein
VSISNSFLNLLQVSTANFGVLRKVGLAGLLQWQISALHRTASPYSKAGLKNPNSL